MFYMLLYFGFMLVLGREVNSQEQNIVAAYLPEYRFYLDVESAISCCLTDIILFSVSIESSGMIDDHWLPPHEIRRVRAAADAVPDRPVNVLLCIGGAGRSMGFGSAVSTKSNRNRLLKQLLELVKLYELDGIDFDWEAPQSKADFENYCLLLKLASRSLHKLGKLVTVALHPGQSLVQSSKSNDVLKSLDRIHLMSYDMNGGDRGHSSISDSQKAVQFLLQHDVQPHQIVLGMPAYSRHKVHLGQVKTHAEIVDQLLSTATQDIKAYDSKNMGDINGDYIGNGPKTVQIKTEWSQSVGLGGVMFWELGQDKLDYPTFSLLRVAAETSLLLDGPNGKKKKENTEL